MMVVTMIIIFLIIVLIVVIVIRVVSAVIGLIRVVSGVLVISVGIVIVTITVTVNQIVAHPHRFGEFALDARIAGQLSFKGDIHTPYCYCGVVSGGGMVIGGAESTVSGGLGGGIGALADNREG